MPRQQATWDEVLAKILLNTVMDLGTDCAIYQGRTAGGYGQISFEGRQHPVHRLLYQRFINPSAEIIRHTCDVKRCWNLAHLIDGSQFDNIQDMVRQDRQAKGSQHGMSKLSEDIVREIRTSELSASVLAAKYNVSSALIYYVRNGTIWKHVKD